MSRIKTISITKKELKLITGAIIHQRLVNRTNPKKFVELQNLVEKINKLSVLFEYKMQPIMYDEF